MITVKILMISIAILLVGLIIYMHYDVKQYVEPARPAGWQFNIIIGYLISLPFLVFTIWYVFVYLGAN